MAVVVDVGEIGAHGAEAGMAHAIFEFIAEAAVALVDIEIIPFVGVIGYEYIGAAVAIDIADGDAEAEADQASMDAGLAGDLGEVAVIVAEEVIAAAFEEGGYGPLGVGEVSTVGVVEGIDGDGAVVDHEAVEVAVAVIIEEGDLGGIGGNIEAVLGGGVGESIIMVVDIELVLSVAVLHVAGVADIDIEPAVAVDIGHDGAGAPHAVLAEAGFCGDIFEVEAALVEIELVLAHIGGEEDIGEPVVVDIADGDAAAVVEVAEEEAVSELAVDHLVIEIDAGVVEEGKELACLLVMMAGAKEGGEEEGNDGFAGVHKKGRRPSGMAFGEFIDSILNSAVN